MFCPICKSTAAVGVTACPYCFTVNPRRRRERDERILADFVEGLRGTVRLPDPEQAWWALVSRLAERGPVEIAPAKKLKRSQSK
jgi:hypothetical protein